MTRSQFVKPRYELGARQRAQIPLDRGSQIFDIRSYLDSPSAVSDDNHGAGAFGRDAFADASERDRTSMLPHTRPLLGRDTTPFLLRPSPMPKQKRFRFTA